MHVFRMLFMIGIFACLLILTVACNPTYAPPMRTLHMGAPGTLAKNEGRIDVGSGVAAYPFELGSHFGLADWAVLDVGGLWTLPGAGALGFVGARFAPFPPVQQKRREKLLFDLELGSGLGAGGMLNGNDGRDDLQWYDRLAFGGYSGIGIGVRAYDWWDLYFRGRVHVSKATQIPVTVWGSGGFGMEFTIVNQVILYLGTGIVGYSNSHDSEVFPTIIEGGIGAKFDLVKGAGERWKYK